MRVILFLLSILPVYLYGQQPVHELISIPKGLPSKTVYDIFQDKEGFIWIAHDKGISRYDGVKIKPYVFKSSNGWACTSIQQTPDGCIWVVNFDGNVFYTRASSDSLSEEPLLRTMGFWNRIYNINGQIIKPTLDGLMIFNPFEGSVHTQPLPCKVSGLISCNKEGDELLITAYQLPNEELKLFKFSNGSIQNIDIASRYEKGKQKEALQIFKTLGEYWYLNFNDEVSIENIVTKAIASHKIFSREIILNYFISQDNVFWLCTTQGIFAFDEKLNPMFNGESLFPEYSISSVIIDREEIMWLGTLNEGVIKIPSLSQMVYNFNNESITSLAIDSNEKRLFVGTNHNRVFEWSISQRQSKTIFDGQNNKVVSTMLYNPHKNELALSSDKSYRIDLSTNRISNTNAYVKDYFFHPGSDYAIATPYGFGMLTEAGSGAVLTDEEISTGYKNFSSSFNRTRCVAYNVNNGCYYAGTVNGLMLYKNENSVEILAGDSKMYAVDLAVIGDRVFAGTLNSGLYVLGKEAVTDHFTTEKGLLSNNIIKVKTDKDNVWILSDKGLQCWNGESDYFTDYTFSYALSSEEISDFEVLDQSIFLASDHGVVELPVRNKNFSNFSPVVIIDQFFCDKKRVMPETYATFNADNHFIEFYLSLPNFRHNNAISVYYKINNFEWQKLADGDYVLTLPQLGPGEYEVRFKAVTSEGVSSYEEPWIKFTIQKPFYKETWFVVLFTLVATGVVVGIARNELRKQKMKSDKDKLEKELEASKLASIKSQMNPHFVFNALNTIQSYIYLNDKKNAAEYLGKFSELTRMILDMSNREKVSLTEELRAIHLYLELELQRFEDKLQIDIQVHPAVEPDMVQIPSMLIQPYIENAIKHGLLHKHDNCKLNISFERKGQILEVIIDDNGIGRKRSAELQTIKTKEHQSFAMSANQKRLEILNKQYKNQISISILDKKNELGESAGTTISLFIPI